MDSPAMARSFRDLLEYVLGEIALCGSQGEIDAFYRYMIPC